MACGLSFTSTSSRISRGGDDSKVKGPKVMMGSNRGREYTIGRVQSPLYGHGFAADFSEIRNGSPADADRGRACRDAFIPRGATRRGRASANVPPLSMTCPMHPDVVESSPGDCPICKMKLVPVRLETVWTCPVHPQVAETRCRQVPDRPPRSHPDDGRAHVDVRGAARDRSRRSGHLSRRHADDREADAASARQSQSAARRPVLHGARQLPSSRRRLSARGRVPSLSLRRLRAAAAARSSQAGEGSRRHEGNPRRGDARHQGDSPSSRWPSAAAISKRESTARRRRRRSPRKSGSRTMRRNTGSTSRSRRIRRSRSRPRSATRTRERRRARRAPAIPPAGQPAAAPAAATVAEPASRVSIPAWFRCRFPTPWARWSPSSRRAASRSAS